MQRNQHVTTSMTRCAQVNIIAFFSIVKAAVDHMPPGSCIINMSSVAGAPPGSLDSLRILLLLLLSTPECLLQLDLRSSVSCGRACQ